MMMPAAISPTGIIPTKRIYMTVGALLFISWLEKLLALMTLGEMLTVSVVSFAPEMPLKMLSVRVEL